MMLLTFAISHLCRPFERCCNNLSPQFHLRDRLADLIC